MDGVQYMRFLGLLLFSLKNAKCIVQTKKQKVNQKMKLDVSNLKLAWNYITGGFGGVADYLLDILNNALKDLDANKKDNVQAVLNFTTKVLNILKAISWLCPTKWQFAYKATIDAVQYTADALDDFTIKQEEVSAIYGKFVTAVECWKAPDDGYCMDSVED